MRADEVKPTVPSVVADIIDKLLAKSPADRYQSANGLSADLDRCIHALARLESADESSLGNDCIESFAIGQNDLSGTFRIPAKLYDRERDIRIVLDAFDRVRVGAKEVITVHGPSGIGKSALISEVAQLLKGDSLFFLSGKFDQVAKVPFSAFQFTGIVRKILSKSKSQVERWRQRLLSALGSNGQVVLDLIPELQELVGRLPPVQPLPPLESSHRLNVAMANLLETLASSQQSLLLFLDDVQWADGASLRMLSFIMSKIPANLLVILAYRDTEMKSSHPLMLTISQLEEASCPIIDLQMRPLEVPVITQLISDTIGCKEEQATPLAELVMYKTAGNPFFVEEFLQTIYQEKLLWFNFETHRWQWDMERIAQDTECSENVIEYLVRTIQKLPTQYQRLLITASCFGIEFDINMLARIMRNPPELKAQLGFLENCNLIIQTSTTTYKLLHARVQAAAYSLIPEKERKLLHHEIGCLLLQGITNTAEVGENLIEIVNQLNEAIELVTEPALRLLLSELNLVAGRKAKESTSHDLALKYLVKGIEVLPSDGWTSHFELAYELHLEAAKCEYLMGQYDVCEEHISTLRQHTNSRLKSAAVTCLLMQLYSTQQRHPETLQCGLTCLEEIFNVGVVRNPSAEVAREFDMQVQQAIEAIGLEQLPSLPIVEYDIEHAAVMEVLLLTMDGAYFAEPRSFMVLAAMMILRVLAHGNNAYSPLAYIFYGIVQVNSFRRIEEGYKLGRIGYEMREHFITNIGLSTFLYGEWLHFWRNPLQECTELLFKAFHMCIASGYINYACYCATHIASLSLILGEPLAAVEKKSRRCLTFAKKLQNHGAEHSISGVHRIACLLSDVDLEEESGESFEQLAHKRNNHKVGMCNHYTQLMQLHYTLDQIDEAHAALEEAKKYIQSNMAHRTFVYFYFWGALILAATIKQPASPSSTTTTVTASSTTTTTTTITATSTMTEDQSSESSSISSTSSVNSPPSSPSVTTPRSTIATPSELISSMSDGAPIVAESPLDTLRRYLGVISTWGADSPANFRYLSVIVRAELCRLENDAAEAARLYEEAIRNTRAIGFVHMEALSNELYAKFCDERQRSAAAKAYMNDARRLYERWGASAKVRSLLRHYPSLLRSKVARTLVASSATIASPLPGGTGPEQALLDSALPGGTRKQGSSNSLMPGVPRDSSKHHHRSSMSQSPIPLSLGGGGGGSGLSSGFGGGGSGGLSSGLGGGDEQQEGGFIAQVGRIVMEEVTIASMLKSTMQLLLQYAGAQHGCLLLEHEQRMYIEIEGRLELGSSEAGGGFASSASAITVLHSRPMYDESDEEAPTDATLSPAIVNYVARTKQPVILRNVAEDDQFQGDPYITRTQCKSLLCLPIQLKHELLAVLYLENRLTPGVFDHLSNPVVFNFVVSHMVLCIENQRLNEQLAAINRSGYDTKSLGGMHKRGYLSKVASSSCFTFSGSSSSSWLPQILSKGRWEYFYVLLKQGKLGWFLDHTANKPLGIIRLENVKDVYLVSRDTEAPPTSHVFIRTYPPASGSSAMTSSSGPHSEVTFFKAPPSDFCLVIECTVATAGEKVHIFSATNEIITRQWVEGMLTVLKETSPVYRHGWAQTNVLPQDIQINKTDIILLNRLGSGAAAAVYRAEWKGTPVAVKCLFTSMDNAEVKAFYSEVQILRTLRHPNIVLFLGAYMGDKGPCIVTEFVSRGSLYSILHDPSVTLSMKLKIRFALDAARGMLYLHSFNPPLIHRDLKSHNILVTEDWSLKICDFGVARVRAESRNMTGLQGTCAWMAPEVFQSGLYSELADVFSFGIIMYEIISRKVVYPHLKFASEIGIKVVHENLRPPIPPNCSAEWAKLMTDCWQGDPECRPPFSQIVKFLESMAALQTS